MSSPSTLEFCAGCIERPAVLTQPICSLRRGPLLLHTLALTFLLNIYKSLYETSKTTLDSSLLGGCMGVWPHFRKPLSLLDGGNRSGSVIRGRT